MVNSQLSEFGIVLLFIIGAIAFVLITLTVSRFIRPNRPNYEKLTSYECGEESVGNVWSQFNARFYIIALIFILFEVEILFIFPWATVFGDEKKIAGTDGLWGWFSLTEMFIFISILILGLAYAWGKGFLDWIKPEPEVKDYQSPVPKSLYEALNQKYLKK
ncbi:MAG: NADH-quinone oxidoreductase subunit A [Cytophagaceae bacterium]|nr:NADH-quinone oxidoreductase subunit A [Cytophagaceae bacterium]